MDITLKDKVIVITGSSRGIGRELAKRFAQEQAHVVLNYFNSETEARKLLDEISAHNTNCIMIKADVRKQEDVNFLYKATLKQFGHVDVLINNAGMCGDNLLQLMTQRQWREVMELNLDSVFLCSRSFSKNMIKNKSGKIINITSLKGQIGSQRQTNYSASKAGVIGFTKALSKELGKYNVTVNAVCPGFIVTDLNRGHEVKRITAKKASVLKDYDYLESLLNFMTYMASDDFHSITGQVFNLDSRINWAGSEADV